MTEPSEDMYTITGVIATTGELTGRSFRLGLAHLERLRDRLLAGDPIGFDHDSQQTPLSARLLDVELVQDEAGEYVLRGSWEVSEAEAARVGTRTGFSVTTVDWEVDGWAEVDSPDLVVVPDCYHWDDQDIAEALHAAAASGLRVKGGRLIQLSDAPPIKILLEVVNSTQGAAALWAGIAAAVTALAVKLKRSLSKGDASEPDHAPQLTFEASHGPYKAIVNCSSDESAERIAAQVVEAVKALGGRSESTLSPSADSDGETHGQWTPPA